MNTHTLLHAHTHTLLHAHTHTGRRHQFTGVAVRGTDNKIKSLLKMKRQLIEQALWRARGSLQASRRLPKTHHIPSLRSQRCAQLGTNSHVSVCYHGYRKLEIFELKIFHKNIRVKKCCSYTGGLEKFFMRGQKGDII